MIYSGQAAINFLAEKINSEDPAASSYWREYHKKLSFSGTSFSGISNFGNIDRPYKGLFATFHSLLQQRFHKYGRSFPAYQDIDQVTRTIVKKQNRAYSLDVLRQSLTLAFLKTQIPEKLTPANITWVIGDGFGLMTSLLLETKSAGCVVLVNLTKTLLVDLWYIRLLLGDEKFESTVELVTDSSDITDIRQASLTSGKVIAIQAADHDLLEVLPADVVINIVSMQEMDPEIIDAYFSHIRSAANKGQVFFYCCNREEKRLPDGTITRFAEYPWKMSDRLLTDELCPWNQEYYRVFPPFYRPYDGAIRHQLRQMQGA
jgi:putative sugar O-methyltransferase